LAGSAVEASRGIFGAVEDFEDGEEAGHLQDAFEAAVEAGQLDFGSVMASGVQQAGQDAESAAVDEIDAAEIEHNFFRFGKDILHEVPKIRGFLAEHQTAPTLDNGHATEISRAHLKRHINPPAKEGSRRYE
jgi:hypothetical protein